MLISITAFPEVGCDVLSDAVQVDGKHLAIAGRSNEGQQ
jgi:hypothetical protein